MKYQSKAEVIAAAQASGSTATTWHGARRWMLAHVDVMPLSRIPRPIYDRRKTRQQYQRQEWIRRIESRLDFVAQNMGYWSLADAEALAAELTRPCLVHAEIALQTAWPYRKSESKWAGGDHDVTVSLGDPSANCASSRAWSDNGKWRGTNSSAHITTDLPTLLEFPTLMTRDGLALCRAEKLAPREYKVSWIEQSTGVSLKTVDGYLIRGYHVRAPGIKSARAKAAQARTAAGAATIRQRQAKLTKRAGLAALKSVYVSVEDSVAAGNCKPTTEQYAHQIWAHIGASGPCAVRADVMLMHRDDYYTRRALGIALGHRNVEAA
jgi:hypothetical protein